MVKVYQNDNPSQIYMDALLDLIAEGDELAPRGKRIKELRPVVIGYTNPLNRVTFLKGRVINPFFQLAESLWILAGRSDVQWLTDYNKSIGQFSDDGEYFNAPYGERLRAWNKSDANDFILNPLDQLEDVYKKIKADPDTRQAVAVIYNPMFDHADKETKDRPCNMLLTFKLRNGKLDLQVMNRSNDLHWGTFGANLCQFATIQEAMASWLEVEVGTYYQNTDSLHIYLDDYGAKETDKVLGAYGINGWEEQGIDVPEVQQFTFENEPRMNSNLADMNNIIHGYFTEIDHVLSNEETYKSDMWQRVGEVVNNCPDPYITMTLQAMLAYQGHKKGNVDAMLFALNSMDDSSWRVSCLRFLSKHYGEQDNFKLLYKHYNDDIKRYIERKEA